MLIISKQVQPSRISFARSLLHDSAVDVPVGQLILCLFKLDYFEKSLKIKTHQSWSSFWLCFTWITLKNHLKSRHIKAEVVFYSVLPGLSWKISHNQYKSKFERVWIYFKLIIMKNQSKSMQIKAWRISDSVSTRLPWRISYNQCGSKSEKTACKTCFIFGLFWTHFEFIYSPWCS